MGQEEYMVHLKGKGGVCGVSEGTRREGGMWCV